MLRKGDIVWIDNAPLAASPQATGRTTMCEVLQDCPDSAQQVYLQPLPHGSPLYVFKCWLAEPENFGR